MIGKKIRLFGAMFLLFAVAFISCFLSSVTEVVSSDTFAKDDQAYSLGVEKYTGKGCLLQSQFGPNSVSSGVLQLG